MFIDNNEMNYIAKTFDEMFASFSYGTTFYFVPLLEEGLTVAGAPNLVYDEENKVEINAAMHYFTHGDADVDTTTTYKDNRHEALIQLSVWNKTFKPKERDAFDFIKNGETIRYVIIGMANGVAMPQLSEAYRVVPISDFMLHYNDYVGV